jgi:hypothetical protein
MTELLGPEDASWDERLRHVACDVYHGAGYHRYSASAGEARAFLLVVRDADRGLVWPYLLRSVSAVDGFEGTDAMDVTSVYGYPGPLAWGCRPGDPFLAEAWIEICDVWRSQRVVSAFTRFHPILANVEVARSFRDPPSMGEGASATGSQPEAVGPAIDGPIVPGGTTVSIDCRLDDHTAIADYARVLRQEIARSRRAGLVTEEDESWLELDSFTSLYANTMARNRADSAYEMTRDDAVRLRDSLGGRLHLLVTRLEGAVVAAGLFTEFDGIVQAHLVGTDDAQRQLSPLKVLLDDARRWARGRGDRVLHLGGGRGGHDDSLFAFKRRFSSRRHSFYTGRWILDADAYRELAARRRRFAIDRGADIEDSGWFPAYRAPIVESAASNS